MVSHRFLLLRLYRIIRPDVFVSVHVHSGLIGSGQRGSQRVSVGTIVAFRRSSAQGSDAVGALVDYHIVDGRRIYELLPRPCATFDEMTLRCAELEAEYYAAKDEHYDILLRANTFVQVLTVCESLLSVLQ
jgi:hypothetical protein